MQKEQNKSCKDRCLEAVRSACPELATCLEGGEIKYDDQGNLMMAATKGCIGHPPQLQHWLRLLRNKTQCEVHFRKRPYAKVTFIPPYVCPNGIVFSLEDGQPATDADYQAILDVV